MKKAYLSSSHVERGWMEYLQQDMSTGFGYAYRVLQLN